MPADLAIVDVSIRTLDPAAPTAEAIAVKDGVIVAIGTTPEVREACDATTRVLSGPGWHVTPGLVDGHQHLIMGAQIGRGVSFDRVATLDRVRDLLREERRRIGPGEWLRGYAFEYAALGGLEFHHSLIDDAAGDGPMLLHSLDVHTGVANAEALRIAGVTGSREFPDGSFIVLDDAGRPTGELREMSAIVCVAGMEGALPSVLAGHVACPVIAVPTSVGYGANFAGLSALLSMLNCCASNVAVVNIDAGFKGGYMAGLIAKIGSYGYQL